jgi:hypothetical protein
MFAQRGDVWTSDGSGAHGAFQPPANPFTIPSTFWWPVVDGPQTPLLGTAINGLEMAVPFYISAPTTIKALQVEVTVGGSAGAVVRLGIRNVPSGGLPGSLIVDAGTQATTTTGMKTWTLGSPQALATGWYFYTVTFQGAPTTGATLTAITGPAWNPRFPIITNAPAAAGNYGGYGQSGITSALPATYSVTSWITNPVRVFAQVN